MFRPIAKPTKDYTHIGYLPELHYHILRNAETKALELWTLSRGTTRIATVYQGYELEYIRPVEQAFRVVDNEFNRKNYPDEIGKIYVDRPPSYVSVRDI